MNNPFAAMLLIIIIFCALKKRNVAYLGFPENDVLKKSRIMRVGLPVIGILIAISAFFHSTIYFYIPLFS
jgi:hypothetical protein